MSEFRLIEESRLTRVLSSNAPHGIALLIHGYGQTRSELFGLAVTCASVGFEAVVPDLPGHGLGQESLTVETLREFSSEWMKNSIPSLLIGFSLGARIALDLADGQPVVALSPPVSSRFDSETRAELMDQLRLRWAQAKSNKK